MQVQTGSLAKGKFADFITVPGDLMCATMQLEHIDFFMKDPPVRQESELAGAGFLPLDFLLVAKGDSSKERLAVRGMRTSLLGMFANLLLALAKGIAGLTGHSFALVADGLESLADVASGLVVYFGLKIAIKPPDADHPYGHGKAEPFAALVVGIFLVAAAVAIMIESIHEIRTPHQLPAPYTLVVLAGVSVGQGTAFASRRQHRGANRKYRGSR
jgi:Co/Zn/Cd efflux system component